MTNLNNVASYKEVKDRAAILIGIMLTEVGDKGVGIQEATDTKSLMAAVRNLHKSKVIDTATYSETMKVLSEMRNIELLNA